MATGEKFQQSFSFPSSTELQHLNMAYGDGKMRDLIKGDFESALQNNIHVFFFFSVDLNTSNIDESISSRAS